MTTPTPSTTTTQTDNNTLRTLNKTVTKPTTGDPMSDGSKIGVALVDDVIQKKMKRAERFDEHCQQHREQWSKDMSFSSVIWLDESLIRMQDRIKTMEAVTGYGEKKMKSMGIK
ncbi:hypothetical protein Tco_0769686 [Tanacetum coccineum]|uniref:Uncharacterized protein n=1 Tax=Tanacetum coccineum TaxID=301880 RepID=A0ABQ4ZB49_9ASTR